MQCHTTGFCRLGRTAAMDPLPIETQRDSLAPTGERASAALTCSSAHACGLVFAESDMKTEGGQTSATTVADNRQKYDEARFPINGAL